MHFLILLHFVMSLTLTQSSVYARAKSCAPGTVLKGMFEQPKEALSTPTKETWRDYPVKADALYARLAELEHEERVLFDHPRVGDAYKQELKLAQNRIKRHRDKLYDFNQRYHKLFDFIRKPDKMYALIEKADQKAQIFRDLIVNLNERLAEHQTLVQNFAGKEKSLAMRALKKLESQKRMAEKSLAPLQTKIEAAFEKYPPEKRLKQVTGKSDIAGEKPKNIETADPVFHMLDDGRVKLIGSGWVDREYASMEHLMRNIGEKVTFTDLRYPGGEIIENKVYGLGGPVWDKSIVKFGDEEVLYASALSPKKYRIGGKATDAAYTTTQAENWTRRIYGFHKRFEIINPLTGEKKLWKNYSEFLKAHPQLTYEQARTVKPHETWVRNETPLIGEKVPMEVDWDNHSYGVKIKLNADGRVFYDEKGFAYMEYESVNTKNPRELGHTYPFAERLENPFRGTGERTKLMDTEFVAKNHMGEDEIHSYNATVRNFVNGEGQPLKLIEGPQSANDFLYRTDLPSLQNLPEETRRNFLRRWGDAKKWKITSLAAGDYPTKDYGMLAGLRPIKEGAALSDQMGALTPITEIGRDGKPDLVHLGREQGRRFGQSSGPSRPFFFRYKNKWWRGCHATNETQNMRHLNPRVWPADRELDNTARNVYLSPIEPTLLPDGQISFDDVLELPAHR